MERKGAPLGQLCWLLQALLTQQKDGAKASNVKFSTVSSSPSVLVGLSTANSHRLASKGGCAVGQESGSLNFLNLVELGQPRHGFGQRALLWIDFSVASGPGLALKPS